MSKPQRIPRRTKGERDAANAALKAEHAKKAADDVAVLIQEGRSRLTDEILHAARNHECDEPEIDKALAFLRGLMWNAPDSLGPDLKNIHRLLNEMRIHFASLRPADSLTLLAGVRGAWESIMQTAARKETP